MKKWNDFWFAPASTESLGILRIFYGITLIMKSTGLWGLNRTNWRINLPFRRTAPMGEVGDLYRDPVPGFDWIPAVDAGMWNTFESMALLFAVLWTVGLLTRFSGWAQLAFFALPMLHSRFDYWHHSANFAMFLALFAFLPMGDHYSLDRYLIGGKSPLPKRPILPIRMVQVLLSWVYISTLLGKMNSGWFDGTVMGVLEQGGMLKGPWKPYILSVIGAYELSIFTLFAQFFFFVVVWTRHRRWAWFIGANLHIGIDMLMNVTTFSFQMIALYIAFIAPGAKGTTVYFNGDDDEVLFRARSAKLLDWFDRVRWVDVCEAKDLEADEKKRLINAPGFVVEKPNGEQLVGLHATREVLGLLPVTFLPSFALEAACWIIKPQRLAPAT